MKKYFLFFVFISSFVFGQSFDSTVIKSIDQNELNDLIKNRKGKLLLVNIWATWCVPCREEFPDLVRISNQYKEYLDLIAISVDFPEDVESQVIPFLKKNNVNFPVYLNGFRKDQHLITYFNKSWSGALPATFIYDKEGKQIKYLEGKHSFESFSSIIEEVKN